MRIILLYRTKILSFGDNIISCCFIKHFINLRIFFKKIKIKLHKQYEIKLLFRSVLDWCVVCILFSFYFKKKNISITILVFFSEITKANIICFSNIVNFFFSNNIHFWFLFRFCLISPSDSSLSTMLLFFLKKKLFFFQNLNIMISLVLKHLQELTLVMQP